MRKWIIFHGKCLVFITIFLFLFSIFAIKEYFDAKKVHTNVMERLSRLEAMFK